MARYETRRVELRGDGALFGRCGFDQKMEALAKCASPDDLVKAQRGFMERMQQDYAEECAALTRLVSAPARGGDQAEA
ncbi:MAG: hypothetical protein ACK528_08175 [Alphaproteobacteria bacterium]